MNQLKHNNGKATDYLKNHRMYFDNAIYHLSDMEGIQVSR